MLFVNTTEDYPQHVSKLVQSKLDELFWEWLCLPDAKKIMGRLLRNDGQPLDMSGEFQNRSVIGYCGTGASRPSPPNSPFQQSSQSLLLPGEASELEITLPSSSPGHRTSKPFESAFPPVDDTKPPEDSPLQSIPPFWTPKRSCPPEDAPDLAQKLHECFEGQGITEIRTYTELIPFVSGIVGLSKYFALPILHKIKAFFHIVDDFVSDSPENRASLLEPSATPITETMLLSWCRSRIDLDDTVLTFFSVVRTGHHRDDGGPSIMRDDFNLFLTAILLTHPGLDFLRDTQEFQDRYADTVISRIFYVYDPQNLGHICLRDLRRGKPSIVETWKYLAEHDDIKMVRDYFSYEHFYVIYCTFWELDTDHDFLLDRDDLLKYDRHALSRRVVDQIFTQIPSKFTSSVPGKMGYEDFVRFLLCDQDRSTDRAIEYWFYLFDLDGDGCIREHELKYFYEEQMQRMECLNYETVPFNDVMCQMNDMIFPRVASNFRLSDFKRSREFAGTCFSLFCSLKKFIDFEHRDPVAAKQEPVENSSFSDWDLWCSEEYIRLTMEDGDDENM